MKIDCPLSFDTHINFMADRQYSAAAVDVPKLVVQLTAVSILHFRKRYFKWDAVPVKLMSQPHYECDRGFQDLIALIIIDLMNNEWLIVSSLGSNITITRVMTRTSTINNNSITISNNHKATTPVSSSTTISRPQIKISKFLIEILSSCSIRLI